LIEPNIRIILDAGWRNQRISAWADHYLSDEKMNNRVAEISFASVKDKFGLQGADLIATESFWFNKEWIDVGDETDGRAHFRDFRNGELSRGIIYTRNEVREIANRYLEANSMPLIGEI